MRCLQLYLLYIWISGCYSICHIECKCEGTGSKSKLDCSGNSWIYFPQLPEIPSTVGRISLKYNNIRQLLHGEAKTGQGPNVWSIDISENKILNVEDNVFQHIFPNLAFLDLSRNRIKCIKSKAFINLKLLRGLYLDRNQISSIPKDTFNRLKNLTDLNLAKNQLKVLDFRWFRNLKSLSSLDLADNRIERVKSWTHPWPSSLKIILLNNNRIPLILPIPKHAEIFNLEANPTYCRCIPHTLNLNDISYLPLCSVRMQCNSIAIKGDCKNKQVSEEVYMFWKDIAAKPLCQTPVIKELGVIKNHEGLPYLTCSASGVPAPNITLFSSDRDQTFQVNGAEDTNFTSVTINQLYSGTYHCKAPNIIDEITGKFYVDLNELEVDNEWKLTSSTLNLTSELLFVLTDSTKETFKKTSKLKNTLFVLLVVKTISKTKRTQKIFINYLMN